jgi:hypothetical protein
VPARIRSNVDFPEPFGPISPMRSASETVKETSVKSGFAPKAFEIFCALMIGGKGWDSPDDYSFEVNRKAIVPIQAGIVAGGV